MKLKLNKKNLKNLSKDNKALPLEMTPQIAGGVNPKEIAPNDDCTCTCCSCECCTCGCCSCNP